MTMEKKSVIFNIGCGNDTNFVATKINKYTFLSMINGDKI